MISQGDQASFTLRVTFRARGAVEAMERAAIYTEALGILRPEVQLMSTSLSMSASWSARQAIFCGHAGPDGEECGFPVLRDNDGQWIHASLSYVCRDRWGALLPTSAEHPPAASLAP